VRVRSWCARGRDTRERERTRERDKEKYIFIVRFRAKILRRAWGFKRTKTFNEIHEIEKGRSLSSNIHAGFRRRACHMRESKRKKAREKGDRGREREREREREQKQWHGTWNSLNSIHARFSSTPPHLTRHRPPPPACRPPPIPRNHLCRSFSPAEYQQLSIACMRAYRRQRGQHGIRLSTATQQRTAWHQGSKKRPDTTWYRAEDSEFPLGNRGTRDKQKQGRSGSFGAGSVGATLISNGSDLHVCERNGNGLVQRTFRWEIDGTDCRHWKIGTSFPRWATTNITRENRWYRNAWMLNFRSHRTGCAKLKAILKNRSPNYRSANLRESEYRKDRRSIGISSGYRSAPLPDRHVDLSSRPSRSKAEHCDRSRDRSPDSAGRSIAPPLRDRHVRRPRRLGVKAKAGAFA